MQPTAPRHKLFILLYLCRSCLLLVQFINCADAAVAVAAVTVDAVAAGDADAGDAVAVSVSVAVAACQATSIR